MKLVDQSLDRVGCVGHASHSAISEDQLPTDDLVSRPGTLEPLQDLYRVGAPPATKHRLGEQQVDLQLVGGERRPRREQLVHERPGRQSIHQVPGPANQILVEGV